MIKLLIAPLFITSSSCQQLGLDSIESLQKRRQLNIFDSIVNKAVEVFGKASGIDEHGNTEESRAQKDPDSARTIGEVIKARGFEFEEHKVTTEDGYHLRMHRLFLKKDDDVSRPVVFMQHGLLSSSETFVLDGESSTAFAIASEGYDVWLGNNRGNIYSRSHETLNPNDGGKDQGGKFFDFSFYEMGKYDLPAQVDYVLKSTGQEQVSYIGHSQGTSQMFSALSEGHGDIHKKINVFIAMAPIVYLDHTKDWLFSEFSGLNKYVYEGMEKIGVHEVLGPGWELVSKAVCIFDNFLCDIGKAKSTPMTPYINQYQAKVYNQRNKPGASVKQLMHYGQLINSGKFQQFDFFSDKENKKRYGQKRPPLIDLDNIPKRKVEIVLMVGDHDVLAEEYDTRRLTKQLGPETVVEYIMIKDFDHYSFNLPKEGATELIEYIKHWLGKKNPVESQE